MCTDGPECRTTTAPVLRECAEVGRLLDAYRAGVARLAATEGAPAYISAGEWGAVARVCIEYEARLLKLQELPASDAPGLLAKGEQLGAYLDHKADALDEGAIKAVKAYFADVRRLLDTSPRARYAWASTVRRRPGSMQRRGVTGRPGES